MTPGPSRLGYAPPVEGCVACDLTSGRLSLPGGLIHRSGGWVVEHCVGPLGVGTLILKPERHVTALADLTSGEASQLGPLLHLTAQVAGQLVEAEQVYACLWSHAEGVRGHIHFVVQPVTRDQLEQHGTHGPMLQVAMFTKGDSPDPTAVEDAAGRARQLFAALTPAAQRIRTPVSPG